MTEQTLKKAIEIKYEIDRLRGRKAEIEKVQMLYSEEERIAATFGIRVKIGGCYKGETIISAKTAKLMLNKELEDIEKEIETFLNELSDLH